MPQNQSSFSAAPYESLPTLLAYYSKRADEAEREALLGLLLGLINDVSSSAYTELQEMKTFSAFPESEIQFAVLMRLLALLSESSHLVLLSEIILVF